MKRGENLSIVYRTYCVTELDVLKQEIAHLKLPCQNQLNYPSELTVELYYYAH